MGKNLRTWKKCKASGSENFNNKFVRSPSHTRSFWHWKTGSIGIQFPESHLSEKLSNITGSLALLLPLKNEVLNCPTLGAASSPNYLSLHTTHYCFIYTIALLGILVRLSWHSDFIIAEVHDAWFPIGLNALNNVFVDALRFVTASCEFALCCPSPHQCSNIHDGLTCNKTLVGFLDKVKVKLSLVPPSPYL